MNSGAGCISGFVDLHEPDLSAHVRPGNGRHVAAHGGRRGQLFARHGCPRRSADLAPASWACTHTSFGPRWPGLGPNPVHHQLLLEHLAWAKRRLGQPLAGDHARMANSHAATSRQFCPPARGVSAVPTNIACPARPRISRRRTNPIDQPETYLTHLWIFLIR